jgi:predicted GNAT family N-acyltransferase
VARRHAAQAVSLHAQTYALKLYLDAGYQERGARFTEEGIEHVAMEKRLA